MGYSRNIKLRWIVSGKLELDEDGHRDVYSGHSA